MWLYQGKEIKSIGDMGENIPYGFIYKVTHTPTGKAYLGKKSLYHTSKKTLGKKEIAALPKTQGRPQKFKIITKESDWLLYYGSNQEIKQLIKEGKQNEFTREIVCFAYNKKHLGYLEVKMQFIHEVLEHPDKWFNDNINGKWYSSDFIE